MKYNNNYSVLPFYEERAMQFHRLGYTFGEVYPLFCPKTNILPFQIFEPNTDKALTTPKVSALSFALYNPTNDSKFTDIDLSASGLSVKEYSDGGYSIIYTGYLPLPNTLPIGQFYLVLTDSTNNKVYYSELITFVNDIDSYLKIEWQNDEDLVTDTCTIAYTAPKFKNIVYLLTEFGKPEYQFDEEGETRAGHFFATRQVSYKQYKAVFQASEFILDAMRLIRLADYVRITDRYGSVYYADTFLLTTEWQAQGNVANCTIEMTCDTAAKRCGRVFDLSPATIDFNLDFNKDYSTEEE